MGKWITVRNVPILDEHTLRDDKGKVLAVFTEKKLRYIAAKNNKRVKSTGDMAPIVIGHTEDDKPEESQPKIVGYARDYMVRPLFNTGRKAIHATFRLMKSMRDTIRRFPRRSVELWLSDWKIDPISLLGANTPERDLGLLRLSRQGRHKYRRVLPVVDDKKNLKDLVDAVLSAIKQTDVWKYMEEQMQAKDGEEEQLDMGQDDDLEGDVPVEETGDDLDDEVPEEETPEEEDDDEAPVRYNAGCAAPSGSNTYVPSNKVRQSRKAGSPPKEKVRMTKDSERSRLAQYERGMAKMTTTVNKLRLKLARAEREKDLIQLESEGYLLEREEELEDNLHLSDEQWHRHVDKIRVRYQRSPVGQTDDWSESGRSGVKAGMSKDRIQTVIDYATKKGIPFEKALEEMEGA